MALNKLIKTIKKIRVGRGIGSGKGKLHQGVTKDKNLGLESQLKVLKEVKCLYI